MAICDFLVGESAIGRCHFPYWHRGLPNTSNSSQGDPTLGLEQIID